uniref:extracellular calcium-sensing receptor-like n=1 Tax=Myxine glutinosa TaxID=7769 RepID=UPI00358F5BEC
MIICETVTLALCTDSQVKIILFRLSSRALRWAMTMVYAIYEINSNTHLLPNVTLGYFIIDSCFSIPRVLEGTLGYLVNRIETKVVSESVCTPNAIIGPLSSMVSKVLNRLFSMFSIPQISYASSCGCLSDKNIYASFFRTIPSDAVQSIAIARLVKFLGWDYVGTVAVNDDYGNKGVAQFISEGEKDGLCVAFQRSMGLEHDRTDLWNLAELILKHNVTGKTWIGSEAWISSPSLKIPRFADIFEGSIGFGLRRGAVDHLQEFLSGVMKHKMSLQAFLEEFWEITFNCSWNAIDTSTKMCTGLERLDKVETPFTDVSQLRVSYNTYLAVYAIAHSLHDLERCVPGNGPFENESCTTSTSFEPWQLLYYLKKVRFLNNLGETVSFDENGDPPAIYEIINWQMVGASLKFYVVGTFNSSAPRNRHLTLKTSSIKWNRGLRVVPQSICSEACPFGTRKLSRKGEPFCCFDCIPCTEGEYSNLTNSAECHRCPMTTWSTNLRDTCIPMPEEFLAFSEPLAMILLTMDLLGIVLIISVASIMFRCSFMQLPVSLLIHATSGFFAHPYNFRFRCSSMQLPVSLCIHATSSFSAHSCNFRFICSFMQLPCSLLLHATSGFSACSCNFRFLCSFMQLPVSLLVHATSGFSALLVVVVSDNTEVTLPSSRVWVILKKPFVFASACTLPQLVICSGWILLGHDKPSQNMESRVGTSILECVRSEPIWPSCAMAYVGLLTAFCTTLAFQARKLSQLENEIKFITFSMLFFCLVYMSFFPAYISTRGKFNVVIITFAVVTVSYGALGCIFLPKCYVLLLKNKRGP